MRNSCGAAPAHSGCGGACPWARGRVPGGRGPGGSRWRRAQALLVAQRGVVVTWARRRSVAQPAFSHKAQTRRKWRQGSKRRPKWRRQSPKWRRRAARPACRAATGLRARRGECSAFSEAWLAPLAAAGGGPVRSVARRPRPRTSARPPPGIVTREERAAQGSGALRAAFGAPLPGIAASPRRAASAQASGLMAPDPGAVAGSGDLVARVFTSSPAFLSRPPRIGGLSFPN